MRRVAVFRDGNQIGAMIGPDLVIGIGGFGDIVSASLRNLADYYDQHGYQISDNSIEVEVRGKLVSAAGKTPADAIRNLAWIAAERGQEYIVSGSSSRDLRKTPLINQLPPRTPLHLHLNCSMFGDGFGVAKIRNRQPPEQEGGPE